MHFGAITGYIDLPQAAFWLFFLLFVLLVLWLRQQDKLQGYPMKESPFSERRLEGFPEEPEPHVYILSEGGTTTAPAETVQPDLRSVPLYPFDGTPLSPVGNPLLAALGPGAWVMRRDAPMRTEAGDLLLRPMRLLPLWPIGKGDADPRGMRVFDWRWIEVGIVNDCWIDQGIKIIRLLEVDVASGRVLVPIFHTVIHEAAREIQVTALAADQFAEVPRLRNPDVITAREDERLNAYFAAGHFYRGRLPLGRDSIR